MQVKKVHSILCSTHTQKVVVFEDFFWTVPTLPKKGHDKKHPAQFNTIVIDNFKPKKTPYMKFRILQLLLVTVVIHISYKKSTNESPIWQ